MKHLYCLAPFILLGFLGCATDSSPRTTQHSPPPEFTPMSHHDPLDPNRYIEFNRTIDSYQPGQTPCTSVPDGTGGFRTVCNH